jgi:hypothetical protein
LSKWHKQGAQYNKSAGLKIHFEIDDMRYEIKGNRKNIRRDRKTIHPTIATRIFTSKHKAFALNLSQKLRLHTIASISQNWQPTLVTLKR